jgi:hypothetical protein
LGEARRLVLESERSLKERAAIDVKIRDYTTEAIYVLINELLNLGKAVYNLHGNANTKIKNGKLEYAVCLWIYFSVLF